MKKIILSCFVVVAALKCYSSTNTIVVTESKKGIFGYRNVDETHGTYGSELNCANPGFKGCAWKKKPAAFGYNLTEDDLAAIDKKVMATITEEKMSGQFTYGEYLVVFNLNNDAETLTYTIYNREEATKYGYSY